MKANQNSESTTEERAARVLRSASDLLRDALDEMRERFDVVEDLAAAGGRGPGEVQQARVAFEGAYVQALRVVTDLRQLTRVFESEVSQ